MPKTPPPRLVVDLCRILVKKTAERSHCIGWTPIERGLGVPHTALDEAVAYGVAHGLVRVNRVPAGTLAVTYDGVDLAAMGQP